MNIQRNERKIRLAIAAFFYKAGFAAVLSAILLVGVDAQKTGVQSKISEPPTDAAFLDALQESDWKLAKLMIAQGANPNAVSEQHLLSPLFYAVYGQQAEISGLLLQKGANVNANGKDDGANAFESVIYGCQCKTPAQIQNLKTIITTLIKFGTNVNNENKRGEPPLVAAAANFENNAEIVRFLIGQKADVDFVNRFGENVAQIVEDKRLNNSSAQYIFALSKPAVSANVPRPADTEFIETLINSNWKRAARFIKAGANVNAKDEKDTQKTALHYAAENGQIELTDLLVRKGANVNAADDYGLTPLHTAVVGLYAKPNVETVKNLLKAGANVNARDGNRKTPLMIIAESDADDLAIARLLIENGADTNLLNAENETALQIAGFYEHREIADLLRPLTKTGDKKRESLPGKFFKNGNVEIYYLVTGAKTGTPLFVLHGGPGFDHKYFLSNSVFETLGKNRPIIFYDQRGTGDSSKLTISQTATVADELEDLDELRQHLGYEKVDVFGHSWGGFLAMAYAAAFPAAVSHLIVCDTLPPDYANDYSDFEANYPEEFNEMRSKRMQAMTNHDSKMMRESVVAYMKMLFHSAQKRGAFIAASQDFTYNSDVNLKVNGSAGAMDLTKKIQQLKTPTLIIHGKYDVNITPNVAENIHRNIRNSQLVFFEESGHLPFYEEPEKFIRTIEKFL